MIGIGTPSIQSRMERPMFSSYQRISAEKPRF